jgi:hypothetical protein
MAVLNLSSFSGKNHLPLGLAFFAKGGGVNFTCDNAAPTFI